MKLKLLVRSYYIIINTYLSSITFTILVNGGQHLLWPPETEITDFDEFLKNTLRGGASPQFSRGHSSASSQIHRPFYQKLSMIAKSLSLIILYRFTTLHLL